MKSFTATTNIKAPAATVWAIITDAPNYPKWDPGVIRIEGELRPAKR